MTKDDRIRTSSRRRTGLKRLSAAIQAALDEAAGKVSVAEVVGTLEFFKVRIIKELYERK